MRESVWLAAITACRPDIAAACRASHERAIVTSDCALQIDRAAFAACPNDSISYAVMERIGDDPKLMCIIVPLTADWSDVGAWDAV